MNELSATFLYLQTVQTFQHPGALGSPHHLGLSGVAAVVHWGWGLSLLGISQVVQHHTDAGFCWLELTIPADHSRAIPAHPQPPFLQDGSTSLCLPRAAVAAPAFKLGNRSDVNCSLDIKIAGTCFSQAGECWGPVPALAGQAERSGEVFSACHRWGGAWTDPWHGCSLALQGS